MQRATEVRPRVLGSYGHASTAYVFSTFSLGAGKRPQYGFWIIHKEKTATMFWRNVYCWTQLAILCTVRGKLCHYHGRFDTTCKATPNHTLVSCPPPTRLLGDRIFFSLLYWYFIICATWPGCVLCSFWQCTSLSGSLRCQSKMNTLVFVYMEAMRRLH